MLKLDFHANFISFLDKITYKFPTLMLKSNVSAEYVQEIEAIIEEAQQAFNNSFYQKATELYKKAQTLIFSLIYTTGYPSVYMKNDLLLPISPDIEKKIVEASLKLLDAMHGDISFYKPPVKVFDVKIPEEIQYYNSYGFDKDPKYTDKYHEDIDTGLSILDNGNPSLAAEIFTKLITQIGRPITEYQFLTAATCSLNLSTALIILGDSKNAVKIASTAASYYKSANDNLG